MHKERGTVRYINIHKRLLRLCIILIYLVDSFLQDNWSLLFAKHLD